jgi:hypothetical protein
MGRGVARDADQDFQNFVALAERAEEEGFTPYWLGRSFSSDSLVFEGPNVADFGADVVGGGIGMSYAAPIRSGGTVPLYLTLYSRDAWNHVENEICASGSCVTKPWDRTERLTVSVLGRDALLLLISAGARPINSARLIIDLGDTVVRAEAAAGGASVEGGRDVNPLIDPDELLRVMEQLRPYPQ